MADPYIDADGNLIFPSDEPIDPLTLFASLGGNANPNAALEAFGPEAAEVLNKYAREHPEGPSLWERAGNAVTDFIEDPAKATTQFFENPGVTEAAIIAAIAHGVDPTIFGGAAGAGAAPAVLTAGSAPGAAAAATTATLAPGAVILAAPTLTTAVANPGLALGSAISNGLGVAMAPTTATALGNVLIQTATNGGDVGKALTSAATSYGIDLAGAELNKIIAPVVKDIPGLSTNAQSAITSGLTNSAIAMAQGKSGLPALAGAATGYVANSLASQIPGIDKLPKEARRIATASIAAELNGKDPTQAALNTALRLGAQAATSYVDNTLGVSQVAKDAANSLKSGLTDLAADIGRTVSETASSVTDAITQTFSTAMGRQPTAAELDAAKATVLDGGDVDSALSQIISLPEAQTYDRAHTDVTEASAIFKEVYGRDPTDSELADYTGLSEEDVRAQFVTENARIAQEADEALAEQVRQQDARAAQDADEALAEQVRQQDARAAQEADEALAEQVRQQDARAEADQLLVTTPNITTGTPEDGVGPVRPTTEGRADEAVASGMGPGSVGAYEAVSGDLTDEEKSAATGVEQVDVGGVELSPVTVTGTQDTEDLPDYTDDLYGIGDDFVRDDQGLVVVGPRTGESTALPLGGVGPVKPPVVTPPVVTPPVVAKPPVTTTPTSTVAAAEEDAKSRNLVDEILGFDVTADFDPLWLLKDRAQANTTKIASGGYLDDLLADPTSFNDLLRTLRN